MDDSKKVFSDKKYSINGKVYTIMSFFGICLLAFIVLFLSESHVSKKDLVEFEDFETVYISDDRMKFYIENVSVDKYLNVNGWVLEKDNPIRTYKCHVVLENTKNKEVYVLPTAMVKRNDASIAYNNTSEYDNCGFSSMCISKDVPLKNNCMEIILLYENNGESIYFHTGEFVEG